MAGPEFPGSPYPEEQAGIEPFEILPAPLRLQFKKQSLRRSGRQGAMLHCSAILRSMPIY